EDRGEEHGQGDDPGIDELLVVGAREAAAGAPKRGRQAGSEDDQEEERLRQRRDQPGAVAPVADDVSLPDHVDRAPGRAPRIHDGARTGGGFHGHRRPPRVQMAAIARSWSRLPTPSSRIARPVSLRNTSSRLGRLTVTEATGADSSRISPGTNAGPSSTSMRSVAPSTAGSRPK